MFVLCSKITIRGKSFTGVHDVEIKRSIFELGATATVKVPVTAVLRMQGEPPAQIEDAQAIKVGDPIEIQLGYDGAYKVEFQGHVKWLNLKTPLEIECEDAFYLTRSRNVTLQGRATLAAILEKCGLKPVDCAALTIDNFAADNKPVSWVLGKLKTEYGLSIFFDVNGDLHSSKPYDFVSDTVKYRLGWNVIRDDELQFRQTDDAKRKIKVVCIYRDGSKTESTFGPEDGAEKTLCFYDVKDEKELAELVEAELKRYSFAGKIVTLLQPFVVPTMVADIEDPTFSQRNGRYYIESTEVKFGTGGARRTVEIGPKV